MNRRHLFTSMAGIRYDWEDQADGGYLIHGEQPAEAIEAILDRNVAMSNHNDGYTPSREMRRAGSIPMGLIAFWKETEGWDAFDPECADKLKQKLNDLDFLKLRTAPGRI